MDGEPAPPTRRSKSTLGILHKLGRASVGVLGIGWYPLLWRLRAYVPSFIS